MKINRDKTQLFYLGQIEGKASRLANILDCSVGHLPTKYLGLPLASKGPSKEDWRSLIYKLRRKVDGWQAKLLSRGGRLVLVNAVLTNQPVYFLSVFKAPKWVVKGIENIRRDFFWKGSCDTPGKGCLVAWKAVCRSKAEGGLGILNVDVMNKALMTKWWWRFLTRPQLQWNRIIRATYYTRRCPLREGKSFRPDTFWWKGVLSVKDIARWGLSFKVGNGCTVEFWADRWVGQTSLQAAFPELYTLTTNKRIKVSEVVGADGWDWSRVMDVQQREVQGLSQLVTELCERVSGFHLSDVPDMALWRWNTDGKFTVRATYEVLNDGGIRDTRATDLWEIRTPVKVKVFCWLVLKRRIPTAEYLANKGWTGDTACVLCGEDVESADHLFANCVFFRYTLAMSGEGIQPGDFGGGRLATWDRWMGRKHNSGIRNDPKLLVACWWSTWKVRNDFIFRSSLPDPAQVIQRVRNLLLEWRDLEV